MLDKKLESLRAAMKAAGMSNGEIDKAIKEQKNVREILSGGILTDSGQMQEAESGKIENYPAEPQDGRGEIGSYFDFSKSIFKSLIAL